MVSCKFSLKPIHWFRPQTPQTIQASETACRDARARQKDHGCCFFAALALFAVTSWTTCESHLGMATKRATLAAYQTYHWEMAYATHTNIYKNWDFGSGWLLTGFTTCCHVTAIKGSQQLMDLDHAKKVSMPHISPYQGKHGETTFRRRTLAKNHFADRKIMPFWKTIRFLLVPCANNLALGSSISWWVCW